MDSPANYMIRELETFKHVLNLHRTMEKRKAGKFWVKGQRDAAIHQRARRLSSPLIHNGALLLMCKEELTLWSCHLRLLRPSLELFAQVHLIY